MTSLKDHILSKNDRSEKDIEIPEWDFTDEAGNTTDKCVLMVKSISARLRAGIIDGNMDSSTGHMDVKLGAMYPEIVAGSVYYPRNYPDKALAGKLVFDKDDIPLLFEKNADVIERIVVTALELSGINQTSVDDAAKNSSETLIGGPTST